MNKLTLMGRLTRDYKAINKTSGVITIVTNETYKNKEGQYEDKATFHNVIVFNKTNEIAEKICKKGDLFTIEGKLSYSSKEEENGQKRYYTNIIALNLKKWVSSNKNETKKEEPTNTPEGIETINPDDIPF